MVSTTDCVEKPKPIAGNKVSKPLMEKKRRARINKCLDQLKSLLESYYSTSIRKRKLEKADILELTVKHLRNLQKIQSCAAAASEFSEYQTGFSSCLANVNQYLLMADNLKGSERWMLSQLSSKLSRSRGAEERFSTTDSGAEQAEPLGLLPSEERNTNTSKALKPHSASTPPCSHTHHARQVPGTKQGGGAVADGERNKMFHLVGHRNEVAVAQRNMWRPW